MTCACEPRCKGAARFVFKALKCPSGGTDGRTQQAYDDIPGTVVFDAEQAKEGYHLNMFCMSLMKDENRKAFKADEAKYLDRFPMTQEQRDAILNRD